MAVTNYMIWLAVIAWYRKMVQLLDRGIIYIEKGKKRTKTTSR